MKQSPRTDQDYVDVRELLDGYVRRDCWNCGHEWVSRYMIYSDDLSQNATCPECGWTMGQDFKDELAKEATA